MAYRYVLRKYKLPVEEETGYKARQAWEKLKRELKPEELEALVEDEFVVKDKPRGWLQSLKKQVLG